MPEATFAHPLFGNVRFRTAHDVWIRGDKIEFISGFDTNDITSVFVPQLANVPGSNHGKLRFHKRCHQQLLRAFADIERLNLLRHVRTCAGALNFRLRKPTSGALSKLPSNHAFGIAIDLNADDGSLGASVAPVAPVFQALGFRWGIEFNDPMHFEVDEIIDNPVSVSAPLAAFFSELSDTTRTAATRSRRSTARTARKRTSKRTRKTARKTARKTRRSRSSRRTA